MSAKWMKYCGQKTKFAHTSDGRVVTCMVRSTGEGFSWHVQATEGMKPVYISRGTEKTEMRAMEAADLAVLRESEKANAIELDK